MFRSRVVAACAAAALASAWPTAGAEAVAGRDDRFLAGYVTALLELRFGLTAVAPEVQGGVLRLDPAVLGRHDPQAVLDALAGVDGLRVELDERGDGTPPTVAAGEDEEAEPPPQVVEEEDLLTDALPAEGVFAPLLADPKEPQFSAALQLYEGDEALGTVGAANFGATLPLYGWEALGGIWQVGVQGGVFSVFDLEAESTDLVNADYLVAVPLTVDYGPLAARARVAHQSSHLGDEFLLRSRTDRVNLSYEFADLLLSADAFDGALRAYGGGGALLRREPSDLDRFFVQGGVELTSPYPLAGDLLFPVAAVDLQAAEETDWDLNVSVRAGVDIRSELLAGRRLQALASYYQGRSPNGQFYERGIEFYGFGLYFYF